MAELSNSNVIWWGLIVGVLIFIALVVIIILLALPSSSERESPEEEGRSELWTRETSACKPLGEVCSGESSEAYVLTCYYSTAADFLNYNNWRCYLGRTDYGSISTLDNEAVKELCGGEGGGEDADDYYPNCWEIDWYADKTGLLNGMVPEDYLWEATNAFFIDPTEGFVSYASGCRNLDKIVGETDDGVVELRAFKVPEALDAIADGAPRFKIAAPRLESRQTFNDGGVFLIDIDHIPAECGVWPAFWLVGGPDSWTSSNPNDQQDWPNYGEIDIIEQVNNVAQTHTTLHTKEGCSIQGTVSSGGSLGSSNCADGGSKVGCSINFPDFSSRNVDRNGVYACEWIPNKEINFWFFPTESVPDEIKNGIEYGNSVDTSQWENQTDFWSKMDLSGGCDQDFFQNLRIVINTTFCGDWAGKRDLGDCIFDVPNGDEPPVGCNNLITDFIKDYKAYETIPDYTWRIKSIRVYQKCSTSSV